MTVYSIELNWRTITVIRAIMVGLRAGMDGATGGSTSFAKADRSRFFAGVGEDGVRELGNRN